MQFKNKFGEPSSQSPNKRIQTQPAEETKLINVQQQQSRNNAVALPNQSQSMHVINNQKPAL